MKKYCLLALLLAPSLGFAQASKEITLKVNIPDIKTEPYHRPYVAIWLEDSQRQAVSTIAVWWKKDTWLKDMRQWWRKSGKSLGEGLDAYSGPTKKPGDYTVKWAPVDAKGKKLAPGKYILNFESVREEGGRDHVQQEIEIGKAASFTIAPTKELGAIVIDVPAL